MQVSASCQARRARNERGLTALADHLLRGPVRPALVEKLFVSAGRCDALFEPLSIFCFGPTAVVFEYVCLPLRQQRAQRISNFF